MADIIKKPTVGPTKSLTTKADELDAAISNPDYVCPPPVQDEFLTYLTTWIYPVYAFDDMDISLTVSGGLMQELPQSDVWNSFGAEDGTLIQLRWFYADGPYDSFVWNSFGAEDGTLTQLRWFYADGPYDSLVYNTFGVEDGELLNKLVRAESPDELLDMSITINDTCTMDLI